VEKYHSALNKGKIHVSDVANCCRAFHQKSAAKEFLKSANFTQSYKAPSQVVPSALQKYLTPQNQERLTFQLIQNQDEGTFVISVVLLTSCNRYWDCCTRNTKHSTHQ